MSPFCRGDLIILEPNPTAMWDAWETMFMEIVDKHARLKQSGSQKNILGGLRKKESYY